MNCPTCPVCESPDCVARVAHPAGEFECGHCRLLFNGDGIEALAMAERRREYQRRQEHGPHRPLPVQTWQRHRREETNA